MRFFKNKQITARPDTVGTEQATLQQVNRIMFAGYKIAVVMCDLELLVYCDPNNKYWFGEEARHEIQIMFENNELPHIIKQYMIVHFIAPTAQRLLDTAGYYYEPNIKIINNVTAVEAKYLQREFEAMIPQAEAMWNYRNKRKVG